MATNACSYNTVKLSETRHVFRTGIHRQVLRHLSLLVQQQQQQHQHSAGVHLYRFRCCFTVWHPQQCIRGFKSRKGGECMVGSFIVPFICIPSRVDLAPGWDSPGWFLRPHEATSSGASAASRPGVVLLLPPAPGWSRAGQTDRQTGEPGSNPVASGEFFFLAVLVSHPAHPGAGRKRDSGGESASLRPGQRSFRNCRTMPAICRNLSFFRCLRAIRARDVSSGSWV